MARQKKKSLLRRAISAATRGGFERAYEQVRIDEQKFMRHLQRAHRLPLRSWNDMFLLGPEIANPIAASTIRSAARMAALEGMGLGFGGFLTAVPDMGILAAITLRMLQKLSLIYGFPYATEDERAALWIAVGSAAGVDLGRDFVEKQAIERLVPRIIDRVAVKVGAEVADKWAGRVVPVLSAGFAAAINFYFVRAWGRRAQRHFLERHLEVIGRPSVARIELPPQPRLLPSGSTS
ncbi:MAG TPA: EcsC family protein [Candidatus Acidoferrales bacterium]|nr:EcsC family protein [Candidatus Acidoferrales bacterium]